MKRRYYSRFPRGPSPKGVSKGAPKREERSRPPLHTRVAVFIAYYPGATHSEIRCELQKKFRRAERNRGYDVACKECWPETLDASKEAFSRIIGVAEKLYWLAKAFLLGFGK